MGNCCVQAVSTDQFSCLIFFKISGGCPVPESHAHLGLLIQQRDNSHGLLINPVSSWSLSTVDRATHL